MKTPVRKVRCAIYTRKSSEEGLEMEFNSLDAQREAALAYVQSQKHERWILIGDATTTAAFPAARWNGRRSNVCCAMSSAASSM